MLDILLLILKIIGIILAVLLGLVILIILTVLFVPIRYNIKASYYDNKPSADVRVTALFHLVRFKLTYIEELKYRVKVLFFTVYSSEKKDKAKTKKSRDDKRVGKKDSEKSVFDEEEEVIQDSPDEADVAYSAQGSIYEADVTYSTQDSVADGAPDSVSDSVNVTDSTSDEKTDEPPKPVKKIREIIDRIKELYKSVKEKIVSILESIRTKKEDLSEKIDSFYETVNNEDNREFVRFLWEQIKKLLKIIKPKKGKLYVHYGMDDPETTGKIAMYLAVLYGLMGVDIHILPDFEQKIMEGELQLKGGIRLFGIVVIAIRVYMNKQFKKIVLKK